MEGFIYTQKKQKEALINEIKGNLFEYLVAKNLACHYKIERDFVRGFTGELRKKLTEYQQWLLREDSQLYHRLFSLSDAVSTAISPRLPKDIFQVRVIGKIAGASHDQTWREGDILLYGESGIVPISLKLCKDCSFVNTKSGGVRSFLLKYFAKLPGHEEWQSRLTQAVEQNFARMIHELYDATGLEFSGNFDRQWEQIGLGELPGALPKDLSSIVGNYYSRVIGVIHQAFVDFYQNARQQFVDALHPLLGIGDTRIVQVICFHRGTSPGYCRYALAKITIRDFSDLKSLEKVLIMPLKPRISSFELKMGEVLLQIRLKPMNKFTVPALKVNCSVKE